MALTASRRARFARALDTMTHTYAPQAPHAQPSRRRAWAVTLGLLALVLAGGVSAGLHLIAPVPVSAAQRTLDRVAALAAASGGDSAHATYALTATAGMTTTATLDEWVQRDATGDIAQELLTYTDGSGALEGRTLVRNGVATTYNVAANTLISGMLNWGDVPDPLDTAALAALGQGRGAAGAQLSARPDRVIQGHATHVVEIDRPDLPGDPATTLAFDAQTYVLRALDRTQPTDQGTRAITSLRLVGEAHLSATAAPTGTFALGAPPSARPVVAPDGSPNLGMTRLAVAAAVASPGLPAPLLPGHRDGLFLYAAHVSRDPTEAILSYGYSQRPIGSQAQQFGVNIVTEARPVQPTDFMMTAPAAPPQNLALMVAGQSVTATYYNPPTTASHVLLYVTNGIGVRIVGGGMTTRTFLDLVGALVDGHTQPALVAQLQQDLATTPPGADAPH